MRKGTEKVEVSDTALVLVFAGKVGLQDWFREREITCCRGLGNELLTGCRQVSGRGWDRMCLWVLSELVDVTAVTV